MIESRIESRHNDRLKSISRLTHRRTRDEAGLFLIEGCRELSHALKANFPVESVYFCPDLFPGDSCRQLLESLRLDPQGVSELVELSQPAFEKIAYRESPDGLLAVAHQKMTHLIDFPLSENPLIFVLNGIEKPGNLGAILRSADAAGVDLVVLVDCIVDLYNPNVVRASQGLLFKLPIVTTTSQSMLEWLNKNRIPLYAMMPEALEVIWDIDLSGAAAWLLGAESSGIDPFWRNSTVRPIRIPMAGAADSLNVAAAAAVCAFETVRQRRKHGQTETGISGSS